MNNHIAMYQSGEIELFGNSEQFKMKVVEKLHEI